MLLLNLRTQQALNALFQFPHAVAFTNHCVNGEARARERSGDRFGIHGEKDYANAWQQVFQDRCGNDAIRPGHRNIEEDEVGFEFPSFLDGIFAIDSFADIEISLGEKLGQNAARGIAVVSH
jgi:hypothetical protein